MVPKWNRTSTKMRKMQKIFRQTCTEILVLTRRKQNRGNKTQVPKPKYRNRGNDTSVSVGIEAMVPKPGLNHKSSTGQSLV